jgi:hypothetical protein
VQPRDDFMHGMIKEQWNSVVRWENTKKAAWALIFAAITYNIGAFIITTALLSEGKIVEANPLLNIVFGPTGAGAINVLLILLACYIGMIVYMRRALRIVKNYLEEHTSFVRHAYAHSVLFFVPVILSIHASLDFFHDFSLALGGEGIPFFVNFMLYYWGIVYSVIPL